MPAPTTNSERCIDCYRGAASRVRAARHHSHGCAFSRCTAHCTCTREQQRAFRRVWRHWRVRCGSCGVGTSHVCHHTEPRRMRSRRYPYCATCCEQCSGLMTCVEAHARPTYSGGFTVCNNAGCNDQPRIGWMMTPSGGCIYCNNIAQICSQCYRIFQTPQQRAAWGRPHEIVYESAVCLHSVCSHCCRCVSEGRASVSTYRTRPNLHGCGVITEHMRQLKTTSANPIPRFIGVEMEVAGFHRPKRKALEALYNTCVKWHTQIGTDGSIKGKNGVEVRTAPAGGMTHVRQLYEVTKALKNAKAFVNGSCGLHVHVGLHTQEKQRGNYAVGHACRLWEVLEDTMFKLIAPERRTNNYCRRAVGNYTYTADRSGYSANNLDSLFRRVNDRYMAFNTVSVQRHGTIEFRLYQGCINFREILPWTLLCANIVNIGCTATDIDGTADWVKDMGAARFLYAAAPTVGVQEFIRARLPKEDLELEPIRKAKGIVWKRRAA